MFVFDLARPWSNARTRLFARIALGVALWLSVVIPAWPCALKVVHVDAIQMTYNPFFPSAAKSYGTIQVRNTGDKPCQGALAFSSETGSSASAIGSDTISYTLQDDGGRTITVGAPPVSPALSSANQINLGVLTAGGTKTLPFSVGVASGQVRAPQIYRAVLQTIPYEVLGKRFAQAGQAQISPIAISVEAVVSVNLAGGGQFTTVDFGVLSLGSVRSVSLQARSNQRFRFVISSENGGVLKLTTQQQGEPVWKVPYSVRVGDSPETGLSSGRTVTQAHAATPVAGIIAPIHIRMADPSGQRAGVYRDVIAVSIGIDP